MRRNHALFLAAAFGLSLTLAGCFGGTDDGGGSSECTADADCGATEKCFEGACVSKCYKTECPTGETCNEATGQCEGASTGCTADTDCGSTQRCSSGTCVSKCEGVICSGGATCNDTTGECEGSTGPTCTADADCGTNGEVCEAGTCKAGLYGACDTLDCTTGLDCVSVQGKGYCMTPCSTPADCSDPFESCASAGDTAGHCDLNLCAPTDLTQYGIQQADYNGACNSDGNGDGTCVGPVFYAASAGVDYGICVLDGPVAIGGTCTPGADRTTKSQLCDGGTCLAAQGASTGTCGAWCSMLDGQSCDPVAGVAQACSPIQALWGVCMPQSSSPIGDRQACTASQTEEVCVEDHVCAALTSGGQSTCVPWCDQRTGEPCAGSCTSFDTQETILGVCSN